MKERSKKNFKQYLPITKINHTSEISSHSPALWKCKKHCFNTAINNRIKPCSSNFKTQQQKNAVTPSPEESSDTRVLAAKKTAPHRIHWNYSLLTSQCLLLVRHPSGNNHWRISNAIVRQRPPIGDIELLLKSILLREVRMVLLVRLPKTTNFWALSWLTVQPGCNASSKKCMQHYKQ